MGNWVQTHAGLCKYGNIRLSGRLHRTNQHFTLTELLVVIGIIIILVCMLLPAIGTSKFEAQKVKCMNRRKDNYVDVKGYAQDNYDHLPGNIGSAVTDSKMLQCPSFIGTDTNKVAYHTDASHFSDLAKHWNTAYPDDPTNEVSPFWLACPNYSTNEGGGGDVSHYYKGLNAVCYDGSVQWVTQDDVDGMHWNLAYDTNDPKIYHPRLRTRGNTPPFWGVADGLWPDGIWKDDGSGNWTLKEGYWVSGKKKNLKAVAGYYNSEDEWVTLSEGETDPSGDKQWRRKEFTPAGRLVEKIIEE